MGGEARAEATLLAPDCPPLQLAVAMGVEFPVLGASFVPLPLLLPAGKASYPMVFREVSERGWDFTLLPEPTLLEWEKEG